MKTKIEVKGPVINDDQSFFYDYFGQPYISPAKLNEALPKDDSDVELIINSNGGDVYAASDIWTSLKEYHGIVTAKVYGMAASAASVIAMAADKLIMSPTARLMIHNSSTYGEGDHEEFSDVSKLLKGTDKSIAQAYMDKTGKSEKEVLNIMENTSYYTAEEALEAGLIDEVMDFSVEDPVQLFAASNTGMIPPQVIDKFREEIIDEKKNCQTEKSFKITDDLVNEIAERVQNKLRNLNAKPKDEQVINDPFVF